MLFGQRPIDPRELAERLTLGVIAEVERGEDWTTAVKDVLLNLGNEKNRYVAPNKTVGQPEHMLDLLWYAGSDTNDILLAVESEWGGKADVWEDFEKLMQVKAPLKLMIVSTSRHDEQTEALVKGIQELYMRKFSQHVKGEEYLLIEFVHPKKIVYSFYFEVPNDGRIENVQFLPLSTIHYPTK